MNRAAWAETSWLFHWHYNEKSILPLKQFNPWLIYLCCVVPLTLQVRQRLEQTRIRQNPNESAWSAKRTGGGSAHICSRPNFLHAPKHNKNFHPAENVFEKLWITNVRLHLNGAPSIHCVALEICSVAHSSKLVKSKKKHSTYLFRGKLNEPNAFTSINFKKKNDERIGSDDVFSTLALTSLSGQRWLIDVIERQIPHHFHATLLFRLICIGNQWKFISPNEIISYYI